MKIEVIELKSGVGTPKRPPLLFVHGSFSSAEIWRERFMPYFAEQGFDTYALSLRGHGRSDGQMTLHLHSIADYVNDMENTVKQIGKELIPIGHSLGGMVVQKFLEKNDVPAGILLNSLPPSGIMSSINHMLMNSPDLYMQLYMALMISPDMMSFDTLKKLLVSADTHPASLSAIHGSFQSESLRAFNDVTYLDVPRRSLKDKTFPLLVLGGDADRMIPVSALEQTASHHEGDLVIVANAPHATMLDRRWQVVADKMCDWINRKL